MLVETASRTLLWRDGLTMQPYLSNTAQGMKRFRFRMEACDHIDQRKDSEIRWSDGSKEGSTERVSLARFLRSAKVPSFGGGIV